MSQVHDAQVPTARQRASGVEAGTPLKIPRRNSNVSFGFDSCAYGKAEFLKWQHASFHKGVRFAPRAEARTTSSSIRCGIRSRLTHKVTENTARPPCLLGARFLAPSRARAAWGADPDRRHQELLRGDQWARINRQFAESPAGLRHPSSARNSRLLGNGERYCVDEFTD